MLCRTTGVMIFTDDVARLAGFYRDKLGYTVDEARGKSIMFASPEPGGSPYLCARHTQRGLPACSRVPSGRVLAGPTADEMAPSLRLYSSRLADNTGVSLMGDRAILHSRRLRVCITT